MKVFLAIVAFLVVVGIYTWMTSEPDPVPQPPPAEPTVKKWGGKRMHAYNTTFTRGQSSLNVSHINFYNLHRPLAGVEVVINAKVFKRPRWAKPSNFIASRPRAAKTYVPKVITNQQGSTFTAKLLYNKIPSSSLGPSCKNYSSNILDPMLLKITALSGPPVNLTVSSPPAPAGHCFAEKKQPKKKKPAIILQRVKKKSKGRIVVFGWVNNKKLKRVRVVVTKKGFRVNARPRVFRQRFKARFKLPSGKFVIRANYGKKRAATRVVIRR